MERTKKDVAHNVYGRIAVVQTPRSGIVRNGCRCGHVICVASRGWTSAVQLARGIVVGVLSVSMVDSSPSGEQLRTYPIRRPFGRFLRVLMLAITLNIHREKYQLFCSRPQRNRVMALVTPRQRQERLQSRSLYRRYRQKTQPETGARCNN